MVDAIDLKEVYTMTRFLSVVAALGFATLSYADQFTVTNGQTVIAVPAVVSSSSIGSMTNWVASTNYVAGDIVKAFGQPYVCRYAGTSGATNGVFTGKTTITDGGVTWVKAPVGDRRAVMVQRLSGGILDLNFANGAIRLTADGATMSLVEDSVYQGQITATATTNVLVNTLWY
jgi:hypothetical protein